MYWEYVIAGYGFVAVVLATYASSVVARGRRLARRVPPDKQRFLHD